MGFCHGKTVASGSDEVDEGAICCMEFSLTCHQEFVESDVKHQRIVFQSLIGTR